METHSKISYKLISKNAENVIFHEKNYISALNFQYEKTLKTQKCSLKIYYFLRKYFSYLSKEVPLLLSFQKIKLDK